MTTEVIVAESAPPPPTVDAATSQEVVTTVADATVEVARIEADRDIAIAEIQAETTAEIVAASETASERNLGMELEECRQNIAAHRSETAEALSAIREQLSSIQTRLTPPEPLPQNRPPSEESEVTPVNPEAREAAGRAEERPKRSRYRLI
jgi:septation ring formation regulator EzrA